jgi:hypothetical protein
MPGPNLSSDVPPEPASGGFRDLAAVERLPRHPDAELRVAESLPEWDLLPPTEFVQRNRR